MSVDEDGTLIVSGMIPPNVVIPKGTRTIPEDAFRGAPLLTSVTIPEGVQTIGESAFNSCSSLRSVNIPASVEWIGDQAFLWCYSLSSVTFESKEPEEDDGDVYFDSSLEIGDEAFEYCAIANLVLPAHLSYVDEFAFFNASLASVTFLADSRVTDSELYIESGAFANCYYLTTVTFEDRLYDGENEYYNYVGIGYGAFRDCANLANLTLGSGVSYLDSSTFARCTSLESVVLPASLVDFDNWAFDGCISLTSIDVTKGNPQFASFDGVLYDAWAEYYDDYDENDNFVGRVLTGYYKYVMLCPEGKEGVVTISGDTTGIYDGAFRKCTKLSTVFIPETLEGLFDQENVFGDCPASIEYYEVPHITLTLQLGYGDAEPLVKKVALAARNVGDLPFPMRSGYAFEGWWTQPGGSGEGIYSDTPVSDMNGNATLYAKWAEVTYSWSYYVNEQGGATISGVSANAATYVTTPTGDIAIPDFIDGYMVTAISQNSYLISYNSFVTSIRLPAGLTPGNAGGYWAFPYLYGLERVYVPSALAGYESDIRNNLFPGCPESMVFEYYMPESYTITLVAGDGATIDTTEVQTFSEVGSLPIPTRDGYDFMGWWTEADGGEWLAPETKLEGDITAYAHWNTSLWQFATQPCYDAHGMLLGVRITTGEWQPAVTDAHGYSPVGAVEIPYGIAGHPVVAVGYGAFIYCDGVTEVVLPPTVRDIGDHAFYGCSSLERISLPDALRSIAYVAFSGCSSLSSLEIPKGVTSIDASAFNLCSSLDAFQVASENEIYKTIDGALYTKDGATLVAWPNGRTGAANIADGTRAIGRYAFYYSNVSSVAIPGTVERIEYYAFYSCGSLKTIVIPASVTYIGESAFAYSGLIAGGVTIANPDAYVHPTAFSRTAYDASLQFQMIASDGIVTGFTGACPQTLDIAAEAGGATVTEIGYVAFYGGNHDMTPLKTVIIPDTVTKIHGSAFQDCNSLENLEIPSSVISIGDYAFALSYRLREIVIPASVEAIGYDAFGWCYDLRVAYVPSALREAVEAYGVFYGCDDLTINYYDGAAPEYVTVTLDWNDGSGYSENLRKLLVLGDLPMPRKQGYYVEGWYLEPTFRTRVGDDTAAVDGMRLYAKWQEIVYEFTNVWDNHDGTCTLLYLDGYDEYGNWREDPCVSPKPIGRFEVPSKINGLTVVEIGYGAFYNCDEMTEIVIPASVRNFDSWAFAGCTALESIVVAGDGAFSSRDGFMYLNDGETLVACPPGKRGDVAIPSGTKEIMSSAFEFSYRITSVSLPDGVEILDYAAFENCTRMQSIVLPNSLLSIGDCAFNSCSSLSEIYIPASVTEIGFYPFYNCTLLKTIYAPEALEGMFNVPDGAEVVYYGDVVTVDKEYSSVDDLPAALTVAAGVTVTVGVSAEPSADELAALAGRILPRGAEGQDAGYFRVVAKYDAEHGDIALAAEIDEDEIGLDDAVAEIMTPENRANLLTGDALLFENVVDGFYYGVAVAGSLDELVAVAPAGVPREKAQGGAVSIPVARPASSSAFFRVFVSDRPNE